MHYHKTETIHLVMDNLNIHCRKFLTDAFGERLGGKVWDRNAVNFISFLSLAALRTPANPWDTPASHYVECVLSW